MLKTQVTEQNKFFKTNIYNSESLMKFIKGESIRNKNTAKQYYSRLTVFEKFVNKEYEINLDKLIKKFKNKDVFPTLIKWSIVAPFNYVLKQLHKNGCGGRILMDGVTQANQH